jgi:23S rRNA (guanine2445-N2)-methyltransferase / 23S rRNA (guanine2069-N7)-methyltransferase
MVDPADRRGQPAPARPPAPVAEPALNLVATCAFGLEAVVARELADLGLTARPSGTGRVDFAGDWADVARANLWLRTADRVLVRVARFPVGAGDPGFDALFERTRALPWERWIALGSAFPVAGRSVRSAISSVPALQRTVKRAIVDRLRGVHARGVGPGGVVPEATPDQVLGGAPRVAVEVALLHDEATLTIDTSGAGLHKRGYRTGPPGAAALRETLAAGLVLLSVWRPGRPLVDPFCGTGTIAIEAAMIGRRIAPGLGRSFDAERWVMPGAPGELVVRPAAADGPSPARACASPMIPAEVWEEARRLAAEGVIPDRLDPLIHASDVSEEALRAARINARRVATRWPSVGSPGPGDGVEGDIQFIRRDFAELDSRMPYGVIITNPPYGVRLGDAPESEEIHRRMPGVLRNLPTWSVHVLTGRLDLERLFAQPATRRRKLYNSTIECTYFSFLGPKPPDQVRTPAPGPDVPAARERPEGSAHADTPVRTPPAAHADGTSAAAARPGGAPVITPTFGGLTPGDERFIQDFANRLEKNLRHLRRYPSRGITCYRVYDRDVADVPLIIERYHDVFHAVEYERPHTRSVAQQADWLDRLRQTIARTAGVPEGLVVLKPKYRQRGLTQHERLGTERRVMVVQEGGLRFEVNLSDYVDTGLFLDHRLTRAMVRDHVARIPGCRVLNLFGYTGSFSVYAGAGGAAGVVTVDRSNTYLAWAARNLALNALDPRVHDLVRADVPEFLRFAGRRPADRFHLIVCDPPTFSNSKSTDEDWSVADAQPELFALLSAVLHPDGVVYFSNNFRRFRFDALAAARAGLAAREISARTVPPEYRNRRIHRCWILTRMGPDRALAALEAAPATAPGSAPTACGTPGDDPPHAGEVEVPATPIQPSTPRAVQHDIDAADAPATRPAGYGAPSSPAPSEPAPRASRSAVSRPRSSHVSRSSGPAPPVNRATSRPRWNRIVVGMPRTPRSDATAR